MEAADVLVVTAVPAEHAAVLAVETGAAPGSTWQEREGVAVRDFVAEGGTLRVAVVQALGMGGSQAAIASAALVEKLSVRCLAMCGVCAGRRGEVELGDVIVADTLGSIARADGSAAAQLEERDSEGAFIACLEASDPAMALLGPLRTATRWTRRDVEAVLTVIDQALEDRRFGLI